jgi:tetratricopeptide (TPR) repeat protein/predicted Ser/Thr protein kinase
MPPGPIVPGAVLGERYEILQLLGEGGMGTVYKARDRELDRMVALKVIRREMAGNPAILQRFKQELILAREVTHKNVIRIFDLGVADGVQFITMEFIEGRDLSALLEERKFTPDESIRIMRQVCRALEAAHTEGVIHRDLKPQNIMLDARGKVSVMDFGLARSVEMHGMTRTGAMMGTPAYMSPEQARGQRIDARSDLFAFGIIFYELLTGVVPFQADTVLGSLLKRTQEMPPAPAEVDPSIPLPASNVVQKCLAIDPEERYQSASEVLRDLDILAGETVVSPEMLSLVGAGPAKAGAKPRPRRWRVAALGVLLLIAGLFAWQRLSQVPAGPRQPLTLLVADFNNATGDPLFDGTLESVFNIAMEGASFVNAYNRGQARRLGASLQPNATRLDEPLARLVALREGISVIISGSIVRQGEGYRVSVGAIDAATGKPIARRESDAANKEAVLPMIGKLAAPIRNALGDATPESAQIAAAETYTASSLHVAHLYAVAQEALAMGKRDDAIRDYSQAVDLDPNFARAYSGLAVAYMNLKKQPEAGENFKKALALLDRMSEREKYRTLGIYYLSFVRNYQQAIETLRKLVYLYPADGVGYNNLSLAYAFTCNIPEALSASRKALEISPKNLQRRANYAGFSMLAGDFPAAVSEADRVVKENPSFAVGYLPLALSTLARGDVKGTRDIYARLEKVSPRGYSLAKMGEADLELYLGRQREALAALEASAAADQKDQNLGELAHKYVALAETYLALGQPAKAIDAAGKAAQLSPVESILFLSARALVQAGEEAKARGLAAALEKMLQSQTRSYARLIEGEIAQRRKQFPTAVEAFQEAQKLRDSWISHFLLGKAYTEAGHFAEALSELEVCRKRRGEAADLFFADMTTLRYLPPLYYWLGRAQEGLGTKEAALASFGEFLKLRAEATPGAPLVEDARRRGGGR